MYIPIVINHENQILKLVNIRHIIPFRKQFNSTQIQG